MALEDLLTRDDLPEDVRETIREEIAEHKRTEEALRRTKAEFRDLYDNAPDMFVSVDAKTGKVVRCNKATTQALGYAEEEVIGRHISELYHPDSEEKRKKVFHSFVTIGKVRDVELQLKRKDGTKLDVSLNVSAMQDKQGNIQSRSIWRNITERKRAEEELKRHGERLEELVQARAAKLEATTGRLREEVVERRRSEEALRESEERFRISLKNSNITVYSQDRELRYTWVYNPHPELSAASVLGKTDADLVPPEDAAVLTTMKRRVLETGVGTRHTIRFTVEGEPRFYDMTLESMRDSGERIVGVTGAATDITERKQAEEQRLSLEKQLQHAQKLESLGVLAGGVAHDFNNLLVGILGHSDLALSKLPPENPARPNIEGVMQAAERAADLSRQMLAYSGHGHFIVQTTDLSALVSENVHLLKAGIAKGVQLRTNLAEIPAHIKADVGQMQQVIMNLVINGAEAIGERSGYVMISTGFETLPGEEKRYSHFTATELNAGRYVYLEVRDDGPGMDEETLSKVFEPFFTTKFLGRGLGLAALLGIVRGHKGGIAVQSEPGLGTTFRLVFPVTEEAQEDKKVVAAEGSHEGTILVIDDEEIVRNMAREMLTPRGLTVLTAEGGAAGVSLYKERHAEIGLILLDFSMPGMGGEETFKELRKVNPDAPVLLSSGFGREEATRRFGGQGLTGFIQKPYRLATLLTEVRRCLGKA